MDFGELQDYQKKIISNGCGSRAGKIKPPRAEFFKDACDQHDLDYYIGFTEQHRLVADKKLKAGMDLIIESLPVSTLRSIVLPLFRRLPGLCLKPLLRRWSDLYFVGVRLCGGQHFYYGEGPQQLP